MIRSTIKQALFLSLILTGYQSVAIEIVGYGGWQTHTNLSGCCQATGTKFGGGVLGRFSFSKLGTYELSAYSDGRWSEGLLLKPFYIFGSAPRNDTAAGELVTAKTKDRWKWIASLGAGYFSHTTRTTKFDLPTLVTGMNLSNMNQFGYNINANWSVIGIVQLSYAISRSDQSFLTGTFLGAEYDF